MGSITCCWVQKGPTEMQQMIAPETVGSGLEPMPPDHPGQGPEMGMAQTRVW